MLTSRHSVLALTVGLQSAFNGGVAEGMISAWPTVDSVNAAPGGFGCVQLANAANVEDCQASCAASDGCAIFTWNKNSQHCFGRTDGIWAPTNNNDHVVSGCNPETLGTACPGYVALTAVTRYGSQGFRLTCVLPILNNLPC